MRSYSVIAYVGGVGVWSLCVGFLGGEPPATETEDELPRAPSATVVIDLSVVPSDEQGLACAHPGAVEGLRCEYASTEARQEIEVPAAMRLQPYMTIDRHGLLGAGLWTLPAVRRKLERLAGERSNERFVMTCRFFIVGSVPSAHVRWRASGGWDVANHWIAGRFESCEVPR